MQIAYIADQSVMEEMAKCRKILQKLNFADRSDFDGISETVKELLGNPKMPRSIRLFTAITAPILKSGKIFMPITTVRSWMSQK